jgi:hypothetical protein
LKPKDVGDHLRRRVAEILAFEDSGDATVVLPDPPVLLDHHELTPTISVPESPLDVRVNTPVEPRSENRALWDRFMRFFG